MRYDSLIIGSGAGGLTSALSLARKGRSVLMLEAARDLGGMLNPFSRGRYHFDVGVHYVGQAGPNQAMHRLLEGLGLDIPFTEIDPDCIDRYVFPDYETRLVKGIDRWADMLAKDFPKEERSIRRFFRLMVASDHAMKLATRGLRAKDLLPVLGDAWGLARSSRSSFGDVLDRYFQDPRLKAALSGTGRGSGAAPPQGRGPALHAAVAALPEGSLVPGGRKRRDAGSFCGGPGESGGPDQEQDSCDKNKGRKWIFCDGDGGRRPL